MGEAYQMTPEQIEASTAAVAQYQRRENKRDALTQAVLHCACSESAEHVAGVAKIFFDFMEN